VASSLSGSPTVLSGLAILTSALVLKSKDMACLLSVPRRSGTHGRALPTYTKCVTRRRKRLNVRWSQLVNNYLMKPGQPLKFIPKDTLNSFALLVKLALV
jgi:hypothetical protein